MNESDRGAEHQAVLQFWFGALDDRGCATPEKVASWWRKNTDFDQGVQERFGALHAAIMADQKEAWLEEVHSRLAYVIVLDQFSRNMFRDTPQMFAADERALAAAVSGIDHGLDRTLIGDERAFMYLPLMHSEALADQQRCIELFSNFRDASDGELRKRLESNVDFAIRHRDIVAQFGRFPHRNAILGRRSSPEETAFLKEPGSAF